MSLVETIRKKEGCVLHKFAPETKQIYQQEIPNFMPDDLREILMEYYEVEIFSSRGKCPSSSNTWSVGPPFWSDNTITKFFGPAEGEDAWRQSYHDKFYIIASSENDGSEHIGISLDPRLYGMVFYFRVEGLGSPLGMPKIANSFTEWVEKTLESGPQVTSCYWGMPEFKDMGPAIPGDPYYRPFGRQ